MATTTFRPRTPGKSSSPSNARPVVPVPVENTNGSSAQAGARRSSLGFLRRTKSTEPMADRKSSGGKVSKRALREQAREEELRRQREAAAISQYAPRLPDLTPTPQLKTFGGDERPDSVAIISGRLGSRVMSPVPSVPIPPIVRDRMDPYARTESITHRSRYSYASSAVSTINGPRRLRRRKDPTPYNILVIGTHNSGKTSFLEFLRASLALPANKHPTRSPDEFDGPEEPVNQNFASHYIETEIDGERVGLTLWDSQGLEKNVVDLQLREITAFLESKFEDTLTEEMKVIRSPGVRDTHIHCVFLILDPARLDANIAAAQRVGKNTNGKLPGLHHAADILDEDLDLQVFRTIMGKTTVVPVISKADTITTSHMAYLKKAVCESLKQANIDPLGALVLEDPEDDSASEYSDKFDERDEEIDETRSPAEKDDAASRPTVSDTVDMGNKNQITTSPSKYGRSERKASTNSSASTVSPLLPLSILSPDPYSLESKSAPVGRHFPWGFADPYNPEHCDFVKLKDSVFREWRSDLREASRELWYERWRTSRLNHSTNHAGKNRSSTKMGPPPVTGGWATR